MSVDIAAENALTTGRINYSQTNVVGAGDPTNQGFCREFSLNIGEIAHFAVSGGSTSIDIYRIGWYGGDGWRQVATVVNTPTTQPAALTVPNSNGATTCSNWSNTAQWQIPANATSGLYVALVRTQAGSPLAPNGSWIPFIVRDDNADADIIYKTSDGTWALAYNSFGSMGTTQSITGGKCYYGIGGLGAIQDRSFFAAYQRPIVTRSNVEQTYWYACEFPMIRWMERNGFRVKYITGRDLDLNPTVLNKGKIFLSSGHDEYWSAGMRTAVENWRDSGANHSLFLSGNEVFWRTRYDATLDGYWCYKDTMPGPGAHVAGTALDPVTWTGTWKDTRWPENEPEWLLTGTDFRMNGVNDYDALIPQNPYGGHTVWANSSLNDGNITLTKVIGFEADDIRPTQPENSYRILAEYIRSIDNKRADDNGQTYNNNGNLRWGILSQRYLSGAVTVGFGTCQWSWALDNVHDRQSGTPVSGAAQQFTVNLLTDLGAAPQTIQSGLSGRDAQPLNIYGNIPGVVDTRYAVSLGDNTNLATFIVKPDGSLSPGYFQM